VLLFGGNASDRDGFDGARRAELAKLDKISKKKRKLLECVLETATFLSELLST
jgi:hypothetical protein